MRVPLDVLRDGRGLEGISWGLEAEKIRFRHHWVPHGYGAPHRCPMDTPKPPRDPPKPPQGHPWRSPWMFSTMDVVFNVPSVDRCHHPWGSGINGAPHIYGAAPQMPHGHPITTT